MQNEILYLNKQAELFPELSKHFFEFSYFLKNKLFYQFSKKLIEIFNVPFFYSENKFLREFYEKVICKIKERLDCYFLSYFVYLMSHSFDLACSMNIAYIEKILPPIKQVVQNDRESTLIISIITITITIFKNEDNMDLIKGLFSKIHQIEKEITTGTTKFSKLIYIVFYTLKKTYFLRTKNKDQFYHAFVSFSKHLYNQMNLYENEEKLVILRLLHSHLLVNNVYRFDYVLQNDCFKEFTNNFEMKSLNVLNNGQIQTFDALIRSKCPNIDLKKVTMIKFTVFCINRIMNDRSEMDFKLISKIIENDEKFVIQFLINVLDEKLITGKIDFLESKFILYSVYIEKMPLNMKEINEMNEKFKNWRKNKVEKYLNRLKS